MGEGEETKQLDVRHHGPQMVVVSGDGGMLDVVVTWFRDLGLGGLGFRV